MNNLKYKITMFTHMSYKKKCLKWSLVHLLKKILKFSTTKNGHEVLHKNI